MTTISDWPYIFIALYQNDEVMNIQALYGTLHVSYIGHWLSFWSTPSLGRVIFSIFHGVTHVLPYIFHWFRRPSLTAAYGVDFFCDCPPCFSLLYDNLAYLFGLRYKAVIKLNFFQQAGVFFFRKVCLLAPLQHCTFCHDAVPGRLQTKRTFYMRLRHGKGTSTNLISTRTREFSFGGTDGIYFKFWKWFLFDGMDSSEKMAKFGFILGDWCLLVGRT